MLPDMQWSIHWTFRLLMSNVHLFPVSHAISSRKRGEEKMRGREMGAQGNKITFYFDALKRRRETHAYFPGVWVIQYPSAFELTVQVRRREKQHYYDYIRSFFLVDFWSLFSRPSTTLRHRKLSSLVHGDQIQQPYWASLQKTGQQLPHSLQEREWDANKARWGGLRKGLFLTRSRTVSGIGGNISPTFIV